MDKTHPVIRIGIAACQQGKRTLFINCHDLLLRLHTAYEEGGLEYCIGRFVRYNLLIIDEIGYLPVEHDEANLFFN